MIARPNRREATPSVTLTEYLAGMEAAQTARQLEAAIQAPFKHSFRGPTWSRISKARIAAGERIVAAHPHARYVPHFGVGRRLTLCGETYRVGRGQNSTGVRYVWTYAEMWARDVHKANGVSARAAYEIWQRAFDYPHRALGFVSAALAGKLPDPAFNRLILHRSRLQCGEPVRIDRTDAGTRAHRPCKCGDGWLWDWGCGWTGYANFINWHCDRCPRVYTEYVTSKRLLEIRSPAFAASTEKAT